MNSHYSEQKQKMPRSEIWKTITIMKVFFFVYRFENTLFCLVLIFHFVVFSYKIVFIDIDYRLIEAHIISDEIE